MLITFTDFRSSSGEQFAQYVPAAFADRRLSNYRKEPRAEARFTPVARFALQDLQVDRLKNFLGLCVLAQATVQRPAKAGFVQFFQFRFEILVPQLISRFPDY
jgi:hypothetical protein